MESEIKFDPTKPSRTVTDVKPVFDHTKPSRTVNPENFSVYSQKHDTVANTNIEDAIKVDYMSDTQINKTPRENYFGMVKTGDTMGVVKKFSKELRRGALGTLVSELQAVKRFGMQIGAKAEIRKQAFREGKTKTEAEKEVSKWENDIAFEIGEIAKSNEKYREKIGVARKEGDGFVYDIGGGLAQIGFSVLSKSPTLMSGFFGLTQQQEISEEVFTNLQDAEKAGKIGTAVAIPTAMLEFVGLDNLLKTFKGNSIIKNMIRASIVEGSQEMSQQAVEEFITQKYGRREKTTEQTLTDIGYSGLLGFILGGGVSGAFSLANRKAKEKGFTDEKKVKQIVDNINNNEQLKQETVNTLKRQNDNTTHYGNNVDNGIAEVEKAIQEKREQYKNKTLREVLIEEARGENYNFTEEMLYNTLDDYDNAIKDLNKLEKPKSLVQFINENGGIHDEMGDLVSMYIRHKAPFILRKDKLNKNGLPVTPDEVGLRAYEAGYFDKRPTVSELLDAISNDLKGEHTYTQDGYDLETQKGELEDFISSIDREIDIDKVRQLKNLPDKQRNRPALLEEAVKQQSVLDEIAQQREQEAIGRDIDTIINKNLSVQREIASENFFKKTIGKVKNFNLKDAFESTVTPVTSLIERIDKKLYLKVERFFYQSGIEQEKSLKKIKPFIDKFKKVKEDDFYTMDLLMKNISMKDRTIGQAYRERLDELLKKYNIENEFATSRDELNRIYKELKNVGIELGFREDYIPRMVDSNKKEDFLAYLAKSEKYSEIMHALNQEKFYKDMSIEERAKFVNNFLRGYIPKNILTFSRIGNIKFERTIEELDGDLNRFYLPTTKAIPRYIESTIKLIEQKKLFGAETKEVSTLRTLIKRKRTQLEKNKGTEKESKIKEELNLLENQVELLSTRSLSDSVGQIVYELASKGEISSREEQIIKRGLVSVLNYQRTPKGIQLAKDLTYAITLGNVRNSITQIADLTFSAYNAGYLTTGKALIFKKKITAKDIGIDSIMSELSDIDGMSKYINKEFKLTGLRYVDLLGKNTFINSAFSDTKKKLQKGNKEINQELDFIFEEKAEQVKKDILNDNYTEDVGFYLYNKLSKVQPINIGSMPLVYLEHPTARLLYSLKTFTIRQLQFTRDEIFSNLKTQHVKAVKNLVRLQIALMLMGGTTDLIKSLLYDDEINIKDIFLNNLLLFNLLDRYTIKSVKQRGLGTAVLNVVEPPIFDILDKASKGRFLDITPFGKDIKAIEEKL